MVFIPVSYSILVIISDLAATTKRAGRADDGEDGPMARAEDGGGRPMQKADAKGRWQRPMPKADGKGRWQRPMAKAEDTKV